MGFRIEAPKQDGNARFDTLKVNLNENNSATRTVVADTDGNFYYGAGGGGGTGGTNGTSGANGTSGTSGTGFNTISNPLLNRVLLSDGSTNSAIAATNLNFSNNTLQVTGSLIADTLLINSDVFEFTGSLRVLGGITGSLLGTSSWAINALTSSFVTASNVYGPYGSNSIISASNAATASSADTFVIRSDKFEFTGSLQVLGGITGSLYGTSSWAVSASWSPGSAQSDTASYVSSSNVYGPYGFDSIQTASFAFTASSADTFVIRSDVFEFTGSVRVLGSITGSLLGTASFAVTASHALNVPVTASHALVASSSVVTDTTTGTGPFYLTFVDGTTGNRPLRVDSNTLTFNATTNVLTATASFAISSSYALSSSFAISSSTAITSSHALTASSADNFFVRQNITASNGLINNTLTAQTLVVQTITSSIIYSSGSNIFGNQVTNIQQFTGSLRVSGSLNHYIVGANVGININAPSTLLHLKKDQTALTSIRVDNANLTSDGGVSLKLYRETSNIRPAYVEYGNVTPSTTWYGGILYNAGNANTVWSLSTADSLASSLFNINTSGNVGIDAVTPAAKLQIGTSISDTGTQKVRIAQAYSANNVVDALHIDHAGAGVWADGVAISIGYKSSLYGSYTSRIVNYLNTATTTATRLQLQTQAGGGTTWNTGILIDDTGKVGVGTTGPTYALDVLGTIRATGDVIAYSDARVKDNVETITDALTKVKSLRGVSYTRNDSEDKSTKIGIIAQEVLKVLPEVVQQDDKGKYSVAYGNMVGLLIEAIKEQQEQIEELKYLLKKQ
jgi:hypothetical protein